jgi:glucose/arabinose dehydrogenase
VLWWPIMSRWLPCVVLVALAAPACEKKTPPTPSPGGGQAETITGRERIGWEQAAPGASELATFRYAMYVDGARSEIAAVTCAPSATATGFACSGSLPTLSQGSHTLELAAFVVDGDIFESPRSASLRVTVQAATASEAGEAPWASGPAGVTSDGVPLVVERIAGGLVDPTDMAIAPDGRLFVAERAGRIRVIDEADERSEALSPIDVEGGHLLSVALDAQFDRSRFVYAVYAASSRAGSMYRLARYREVRGSLGERAVLINDLAPASESPAASLRAMPDGRLLVAIGDVGWEGASSFNGKLLRVERDGTTPRDQYGQPIVADGLGQPRGLAWDGARSSARIVERAGEAGTLSSIVIVPPHKARVSLKYHIAEPGIGSVAVCDGNILPTFKNNVLIASDEGRHILRLSIPESGTSRPFAIERLLLDRVGGVRLVAVAPAGAIYFSTAEAVGRLTQGPTLRVVSRHNGR